MVRILFVSIGVLVSAVAWLLLWPPNSRGGRFCVYLIFFVALWIAATLIAQLFLPDHRPVSRPAVVGRLIIGLAAAALGTATLAQVSSNLPEPQESPRSGPLSPATSSAVPTSVSPQTSPESPDETTAEQTPTPTLAPSTDPSTKADSRPSRSVASAAPSENPGPLNLRIDFGPGKIGKDIYRSPHQFGWISSVYDDNGTLSTGCYIKWALYHGNEKIYTYRTICNNNPYTHLRLGPGKYNFVGHITTDDGRMGKGSKTFSVVSS